MQIGKRIRELRKTKSMTLAELSQRSGVQLATLSRMENLKMTGTVESHVQIAKALGLDLPSLYKDITREDAVGPKQTPKTLKDTFSHSDQAYFEILTTQVLSKKMMPVLLKIEPKGRTNPEQNQPGTEKFVFVLEGEVTVQLGGQTYPLKKNNTFYFDAAVEHCFLNAGGAACKVIVVCTPVAL